MSRRLIMFTSFPRVGGHSTLTYGLCRLLRPHFSEIEVWCKTMPEHGHSTAIAAKLEELGCKVVLLSDEKGKLNLGTVASTLLSARKKGCDVFFTLAMRHLSLPLASLVGARNSVYYHITHDLNAKTVQRLNFYSRIFRTMVFICPATYDEFPGASSNPRWTWVPQSSEIPVRETEKLAGERAAVLRPEQPIRFGLMGRLTVDKGSAAMIEFIDQAKVPCEFHIAGSGPFAEAFQEREKRPAGQSPITVKFHGAYDPTERESFLRKFFAGVDYLLVPSQDEWETLSMATLESLQYGVPALLCRTGGLKSFGHAQLGPAPEEVVRLVDTAAYADTLVMLATRPRRAEAVAECREYYERFFSDEKVRERWLKALS
ncbi:hypothetical protein BH09VER1_BH09VER1_52470 [soil metagenome]